MVDPPGFNADSFEEDADGVSVEVQHPSLDVPTAHCRALLEYVMLEEGAELKRLLVVLADHCTVREINRRFLDHDYDTDVLAFDYGGEDDKINGEMYVDLDTAHERCEEFDARFEEEVLRYAVHGLLHLIGYSDKTRAGKEEMHSLEDRYLDAAAS